MLDTLTVTTLYVTKLKLTTIALKEQNLLLAFHQVFHHLKIQGSPNFNQKKNSLHASLESFHLPN